ncbi:unnamed protein product [Penicillium salamii]|nr:unnamed protein product [Penicillium salamii]CAG8270589.1 unnamed protein product [Penicillium salamii]CAG8404986.1 unnamed protein product [Penicillium salamii]
MVDLTRSDDGTFRPGVPFGLPEGLQWIWSQTGHSVPHPSSKEAPWERPRRSAIRPRWTSPELPDRLLLKSFLEVYMRSPMRRIFPVIDPAFFPQTIEAAYSHTNPPNIRNHSAHACILTFMALVSSLHPFDPTYNGAHLPSIPRDSYVAHASTLLPAIIQGPLNFDSLQAAILLALLSILAGEIQIGVHYTSIASRLLITAGAHTMSDDFNCSSTTPSNLRQHLRTLFWFCYTLDRDLSLRTGQPHCLRDEDCILDIPPVYKENLHLCLDHSPGSADTNLGSPIFPCDLRLSKIKSRTFDALYSRRAFQKSDVDLLRSIRELDEELECWRMSLPENLRPQLSFAPGHTKPKNTYRVFAHMNYYCCVNLIHLAGGRCSAWRSGSTTVRETLDGIQLSLTLSVEASRSLLLFLDDSEARISAASFWSLLFYPMSAAITIFCNLLQNLHADSVKRDLHLLTLAEKTTARLFLRRDSVFDRVSDLQPVTASISALREHAERASLGKLAD